LYLAISLSGAAGAVGLNLLGARHLSWLAAAFVLTAAGLTWPSGRRDRHRSSTTHTTRPTAPAP